MLNLWQWQYQARAEPVLNQENFGLVSSWFQQASEPVREPEELVGEGRSGSQEIVEPTLFITPEFGWLVQQPTPPLPDEQPLEGWNVVNVFPAVGLSDFDWYVQQHDAPQDDESHVPEGGVWSITEPTLFVARALDWLVQHPDPPLDHAPNVAEGWTRSELSSPLSVLLQWYVQYPEPLPDPSILGEGESRNITEPTLFVSQNLGWLVQHEEPIAEQEIVIENWSITENAIVPAVLAKIDWLVQYPGPLPEPKVLDEGAVRFTVEPTIFTSYSIGWYVQQPEPLPDPIHPDEGMSVQVLGFPTGTPTYNSYGVPFLYTASNWTGVVFRFEAYMQATSGIVAGRVWDKTISAAVAGSDLQALAVVTTEFVRKRSSSALSLTNGHEYESQFARIANGIGNVLGAHLVAGAS